MLPGKVRIGVVGLGIGRWHIENYLAIPEAKVSAICDIDEEKLKTITTRYGIAKTYTSYEKLCQNDDIDAISICVPNYMHAPVAICALENGKHVLCEKPLSTLPEDGKKILEISSKFPDLKAMVAMRFRFNRDAMYIKKMIERGDMGEVYYGFTNYLKRFRVASKISSRHVIKEFSGGGTFIDDGLHLFDLIWWLMDCPKPVEVFGNTYSRGADTWAWNPDTFDVEDMASGIVKFENGASIMFESAWDAFMDREIIGTRLWGTKGTATLWPFRICYIEEGRLVSKTPDLGDTDSLNQFEHFIRCIMDNKQPIPTLEQGVAILRILDAVYHSAKTGKSCSITFL